MNSALLAAVANHLWQSSLFAAAIWLLTLALRKNRAAVRHCLWLAASVKFLIPFSLLVSVGGHFPWRTASLTASPQIAVVMQTVSRPFTTEDPSIVPVDAPRAPHSQPRMPAVFVSVWIGGFAASIVWWLVGWRQLRRSVRQARPLSAPLAVEVPIRVMSCVDSLEPGVFGIFRPVLLLPEGITERLSAGQLQSVIAHELCHVRRGDNLVAAIHMLVEAVFWFHPLVWWIKVRLMAEQERACDEEVLRLGADRQTYAESILKICEFYVTSPLMCVSGIAGSNLKKRIRSIMTNEIGVPLGFGRRALLAVAATVALAVPVATGVLHAKGGQSVERAIPALLEPVVTEQERPATATIAESQTARPAAPIARENSTSAAADVGVASRELISAEPAVSPIAAAAADVQGGWEIKELLNGPHAGRIQIIFYLNGGMSGSNYPYDPSVFRGLPLTQIESRAPVKTPARFDIVREAGTFVCEGFFDAGIGAGAFVFQPNPAFRTQMIALGFSDVDERQFLRMAISDVGPRFLGELRAAGVAVTTPSELTQIMANGVTGEYVRDIRQMGYTPDARELVRMSQQGVTIDFARDIRELYPTASIQDLIQLRRQGISTDFVRETRQLYPAASIEDLVNIKKRGVD